MTTRNLPTIAEGARSIKSLSTFSRLLTLTGLDKTVEGEGPYTLFAPTDEAFAALPPSSLASLEKNPDLLRGTLEYHILPIGRELAELRNGKQTTLQGTLLNVSVTDDGIQLDHANTRGYPMSCANGMIHQIDAVLFPGFTPELSAKATKDSAWSGRRPESHIAKSASQDAESYFETPTDRPSESP